MLIKKRSIITHRRQYYFKKDFYNFPNLYFEPIYQTELNLYNHQMTLFKNDKKVMLYTFLNSLLLLKNNLFITYKNITFLYKLPKDTFLETYNSK
jgi:hypothetical protein